MYCRNNPIIYTDPSGNSWLSEAWEKSGADKFWNQNRYEVLAGVAIIATGFVPGILANSMFAGGVMGGVQAAITGQSVSKGILSGTIIGAVTGGLGQAFGNIPVIKGNGLGAYLGNAGIEVAESATIGGITGGLTSSLSGGNFVEGFKNGAIFGAALGVLKVAMFGVRYSPDVSQSEIDREYARQSMTDYSGVGPAYPDQTGISIRNYGRLPNWTGRSFGFIKNVGMVNSKMNNVIELAHEMRHIGQVQKMGVIPWMGRYIKDLLINFSQLYKEGNTTLEPNY